MRRSGVIDLGIEKAEKRLINGFFFDFEIEKGVSGIYVLYDSDDKALYVGETTDLKQRVKSHLGKSVFKDEIHRVKLLPLKVLHDKKLRTEMEGYFIDLLNPKYNQHNKGKGIFDEMVIIEKFENDKLRYSGYIGEDLNYERRGRNDSF